MSILSLCIISLIASGFSLPVHEAKRNLSYFPDNNLQQTVTSNEDSSVFSSDGPVIIYEEGNIFSYRVTPRENSYNASADVINVKDKLTCYVDETGDKFSFHLKDSISIEKDVYNLPDRMLIISDIEGNFKGFKMILTGAGVVNENLDWTFGNGHLVLAGDFFDRGINVTECLWLIYKLETQAEMLGGKVHFIIGNHEMMNLKKDYRYVRKKYITNSDSLNLDYEKWYAENSELGKWLRSKNGKR